MDLFDIQREKNLHTQAPLAARLRPKTLEDFVGQEHIVGKDKLLYRAIKADKLSSVIFFGPPGTGKTTLAKIIANTTKSNFVQINATTAGIKDIKETVEEAKKILGIYNKRTILFIDEIHRFNKSQQDALLPGVEDGTLVLIGATTENPYFEVNSALISRSNIFQLNPLTSQNIAKLLNNAIHDKETGFGNLNIVMDKEAVDFLADISNGDGRSALNALEIAVITTEPNPDGCICITVPVVEECIQKRIVKYDKTGENHYDTISAFIKSMRGSDPDGALYYLARMLYAGEDIKFIARRIVICSAEDVGMADPHALQVSVAAAQAIDFIGMPEAKIILAEAAVYVACAPKSNASYCGILSALNDVEKIPITKIPPHLKNAPIDGMKSFGNSIGYKYAHDYDCNYVAQQYLPDELLGRKYYNPTENGVEKRIKETLERRRSDE